MRNLETLGWPESRLGEAMAALARKTGLRLHSADPVNPPSAASTADLSAWLEWHAALLGCEVDPLEATLGSLEAHLASACPALLRVADDVFLAIVVAGKRSLRLLTPDLVLRRVPIQEICNAIRALECPHTNEIRQLLDEAGLSRSHRSKTVNLLLAEQLAERRFDQCWILRGDPGAPASRWLAQANAMRNGGALAAAHTAQYLLWLASWAILGRLSLQGRLDQGWLFAWALLLMTLIPFRVCTTWLQGVLAISVGGLLKRRLLCGAMRLDPEQMRHHGIGGFLGQVLEAEAVESLALTGGVVGLLAAIEILISAFVLGRFAILLAVWCILTAFLAWKFLRRYQDWTGTRMEMTQELVESMVGHRTRLAQLQPEHWHDSEDEHLAKYLDVSYSIDRTGSWLVAAIPRGWLLAGLAFLAPAIVSGQASDTTVALRLGGVLLAWTAFKKLTASFVDIAAAHVAWTRIAPLFRAAAGPEHLGKIYTTQSGSELPEKIIEADRLTFRYRKDGKPALQPCSLTIRRGERILLEGSSGGGKTTFASLLSGMRQPDSGLLLLNGLDRHTLGDATWRKHVAAAPQFHENHILTETLAFNLLMGRRWPPVSEDMDEAESMCRELGLGQLLDRMPSGILQMVGEGGWQLSHGERSRIYIARALLQGAELVILDESFAALDPENLNTALNCALARAETLMVIAHP